MADWFAQNAPASSAAAPPPIAADWFGAHAPDALAARTARLTTPEPAAKGSPEWAAWRNQRGHDLNDEATVAHTPEDLGVLHGLWQSINPLPLLKTVMGNPAGPAAGVSDLISGVYDSHVDQGKKAAAAWKAGDRTEAVGHAMAAALPLVGPAAAQAGEAIGEGRTGEGIGQSLGLVGSVVASGLLKGAPDAALAKLKGAAAVLPDATDEFISNLTGDIAKTARWAPGGQKYTDLLNEVKAGRDAARAARAKAEAKANPAVVRESPAYANFPQTMMEPPPRFTPVPATATPSGRVPGSAARAAATYAAPPSNALPASEAARVFNGIDFAPTSDLTAPPVEDPPVAGPPVAVPAPQPAPPVPEAPAVVSSQVATPTSAAAAVPLPEAPPAAVTPEAALLAKSRAAFGAAKAAPATAEPVPAADIAPTPDIAEEAARHTKADSNRVSAADRWARNLQNLDVPAPALGDDVAWSRLAQNLGERKGYTPSAGTRQLIHERMGQAAAPAETALKTRLGDTLTPPSVLEQQLNDSLAARGVAVPPDATPGPLQSGSNGNATQAGQNGTRGPVSEQVRADSGVAASPAATRTTVDVPGEARSYGANYEVRELADLQPSHHGDTFQRNPHYAIENDRNYDDSVNQRKIIDWSVEGPTGFKARNLLNTAPDSSIGPPVVDSEGNVIGGNGRTMIAQRVFKTNPKGAAAYRAELDRTAHHYGIDPASYAHMKEPMLVRTIDDAEFAGEGAKQKAVTDFNKVGTASLTPSERAIADSRGVSLPTLDDIAARMDREGPDATLAQVLEGKNGIQVLQKLTKDGVVSPQEAAGLGSETKLTKAGKDRISGLMLGRFFTNARQMDFLPDSIRAKMERIAAPLARVEGSPEYSLSGHTRGALDLLEDADAHNAATIDDHVNQRGMFAHQEYSPQAVALAKQLQTRDPLALTGAIRAYAEHAKYAAEYQGPGMMGEFPAPITPAAAFEEQFGRHAVESEAKLKAAKRDAAAALRASGKAAFDAAKAAQN